MARLRLRLRPAEWPEEDQLAWERARRPGADRFDERGAAAHWSSKTIVGVTASYGYLLGYLAAHDPQALSTPLTQRYTRARMRAYVTHLQGEVSSVTLAVYLAHTALMLSALAPGTDWGWFRALATRLRKASQRRDIRQEYVPTAEIVQLGLAMMDDVSDAALTDTRRLRAMAAARQYRDGLVLALLPHRPLRRADLGMIRIGRHLLRDGANWTLTFSAEEMKMARPFSYGFPQALVPYLERYISKVRPIFQGFDSTDRLWLSTKGGPLETGGLYLIVTKRTKAAFGRRINLHRFRHIAVTTIARKHPEKIRAAPHLLGHASGILSNNYYVTADSVEAGKVREKMLREERERLTAPSGILLERQTGRN